MPGAAATRDIAYADPLGPDALDLFARFAGAVNA